MRGSREPTNVNTEKTASFMSSHASQDQHERALSNSASGLRAEVLRVGLHTGYNAEHSESSDDPALREEVVQYSEEQWWAELAIHADIEDGGALEVAIYFEAERVCVGWLDEWGDWRVRIEGLRRPKREGLVNFEAVARPVRLRAESAHLSIPKHETARQ